ncbi:ribosome silencing factor [Anoxynatronum buryatiense]|uniref:Ribosomal silencing factor RsfS n=1 Tax=Anoxynatronum buryatiense TaxID=489973 RepID=A0AA46AIE5_9CLOT|nr:ribosome silencing factor [Anoxynatronum buryatiense]SMP49564.1 ribosome-associated protein [Anoxynatronum buryatiense]
MEKTREFQLVESILKSIDDKKGQQPIVLDLRGISSLCDFFVIASAPSARQVKAIAENIREDLENVDIVVRHQEGLKESRWILMDYGDVVVHLFITEDREHYQLESIWKDAPVLDIDTN